MKTGTRLSLTGLGLLPVAGFVFLTTAVPSCACGGLGMYWADMSYSERVNYRISGELPDFVPDRFKVGQVQ
jgi:hypothetical protein